MPPCCIGKWDVSSRKPILDRMPNAKGFDYYWGPLGANDAGHVVLHENNTLLGKDDDLASFSRRYTDKSIAWMRAAGRKRVTNRSCCTSATR